MAKLPKSWFELRPHATQAALWACDAPVCVVVAGRGSGKTELAKRKLVRCLAESKPWTRPRYFYGAPTHDQAKRIAWQHLLDLTPDSWIKGGKHGPNVSWSELWIRTKYGSELHVVGLDKPQRIEGDQWDGCVLDESSDLKPKTYDLHVFPALTHRDGWCWRIGVPKRYGPSAAEFKAVYTKGQRGEDKNTRSFHWPSSDIVSARVLQWARENLDIKDYREQFEATWESIGGLVFHAFDIDHNVRSCSYDPLLPLIVGSDFNVNPMAWVVMQQHDETLEVIDELFLRDTNTYAALDTLWSRYGERHTAGWRFFGDATGRARRTNATKSDYAIVMSDDRFRRHGCEVRYPLSNPSVVDRFAATNAMFCNANHVRRLWVDRSCKRLIEDLENRANKPNSREPDDSGDIGHMTDALGYVVHKLFPIRTPIEETSGEVYA